MKKLALSFLLLLLFCPLFGQAFTVGLIDTNEVLASMPELKQVEQQIKDAQKRYFQELKFINDEFQSQYEAFEALDKTTDPIIRERRARLLQDTQKKKDSFELQVIEQLQNMQTELMTPLYSRIQEAVKDIGQQDELNLIMEKGEGSKIYFYGNNVVDITPRVIEYIHLSTPSQK